MSLTKEEVQKVAKLARIELDDAEITKFQTQMSAILDYVEQLQKVNTKGVEITAQVTGLENVYRKDELQDPAKLREGVLDQAPEKVANLVKVKSVF